jgi:long-chain acyl-CoA synthetase
LKENFAMATTIPQLLSTQAAAFANKPFLFFPERASQEADSVSECVVTYQVLLETCSQMSHYLQTLGVAHGDKVALLLPNIPEFVFCYWGTMLLGAVACPVNTMLKGGEIAFIVDHSEATVLITTEAFADELSQVVAQLPRLKHIICVPDQPSHGSENTLSQLPFHSHRLETILETSPRTLPEVSATVQASDVAMMIYTSGTTGNPKGVLLTHQNLLANAASIQNWFKLTPESVFCCILPLFHVNGEIVTLMTPLHAGASVVLHRKFSPTHFWESVARYRVTLFSSVPTILSILCQAGKPTVDYASLEFGICGAAPLPVEVHKQFEELLHIPIYEGYGLSETTCYATFNPKNTIHRKIGSIGVAVDNEVAIWDDDNQPVPLGQAGEIVVRGRNVMHAYFKRPDATEEAFAGGWFHTGDIGMQDEDGFFFILDRKKDMIIRGGENIYPREIDELLYAHPAVEDAATIGVLDAKYGEEVKSFVVLKSSWIGEISEKILLEYCSQKIATYKCPKSITFINEIPKGPTGKLLKRELRTLTL